MQRMKVGPSMAAASSKEEAQDDFDDQKIRARTTIIVTFAAFLVIVLTLRVGESEVHACVRESIGHV